MVPPQENEPEDAQTPLMQLPADKEKSTQKI
jgi:hypothetical protein